jgi:hypothetical protein
MQNHATFDPPQFSMDNIFKGTRPCFFFFFNLTIYGTVLKNESSRAGSTEEHLPIEKISEMNVPLINYERKKRKLAE